MGSTAKGKGQGAKGAASRPARAALSVADRSELVRLCRAALEQAARAEHFSMAEWLAARLDGRTVKAAYAEAARLACELNASVGIPPAPGSAGVSPAAGTTKPLRTAGLGTRGPRERERRPVLVLTRELRACLERVAGRVERGEPLPARAEETLAAVEALMSPDR